MSVRKAGWPACRAPLKTSAPSRSSRRNSAVDRDVLESAGGPRGHREEDRPARTKPLPVPVIDRIQVRTHLGVSANWHRILKGSDHRAVIRDPADPAEARATTDPGALACARIARSRAAWVRSGARGRRRSADSSAETARSRSRVCPGPGQRQRRGRRRPLGARQAIERRREPQHRMRSNTACRSARGSDPRPVADGGARSDEGLLPDLGVSPDRHGVFDGAARADATARRPACCRPRSARRRQSGCARRPGSGVVAGRSTPNVRTRRRSYRGPARSGAARGCWFASLPAPLPRAGLECAERDPLETGTEEEDGLEHR